MGIREVARALDVNPGTALRWHRKGMPLEVEPAKLWRAQHAGLRVKPTATSKPPTQPAAADGGSFSSWRTRRERAAALQAEADLAEKRGQLISVAALRDVFGRWLSEAKDILLSVGSRLGPVLAVESDQRAVERAIDDEMNRALLALCGADEALASRQGRGDHAD